MAASKTEIAEWFDEGRREKRSHMIIVCDTFDYEDYPVFADSDEDCVKQYTRYRRKDMQRVMEVYDLRQAKASQMNEVRAWHLPEKR